MIRTLHTLFSVVAMLVLPAVVFAQDTRLQNPLEPDSMAEFIQGVLEALVMIGLPLIALFIVYAGFMFVAAQGNESKLADAKRNFVWVVVGAILILGAWALAQLIGGTIEQIRA